MRLGRRPNKIGPQALVNGQMKKGHGQRVPMTWRGAIDYSISLLTIGPLPITPNSRSTLPIIR